jgi:hypothetical protein
MPGIAAAVWLPNFVFAALSIALLMGAATKVRLRGSG